MERERRVINVRKREEKGGEKGKNGQHWSEKTWENGQKESKLKLLIKGKSLYNYHYLFISGEDDIFSWSNKENKQSSKFTETTILPWYHFFDIYHDINRNQSTV